MLRTSQEFYDNSTFKYRNTRSAITIGVLDNYAKGEVSEIKAANTFFHNVEQLINDKKYDQRYATLEKDVFLLDGSMPLMTKDKISYDANNNMIYTEGEIGVWSQISDSHQNCVVEFDLDNRHSSAGLTLFFDGLSYATNVKCQWYFNNQLLDEVEVENEGATLAIERLVDLYNRIVITMSSSLERRFIKLAEIEFGLTVTFDGEVLESSKSIEKFSLINDTIDSNELDFSIFNYNRFYSVFDLKSMYRYFRYGQTIKVESGVLNRKTKEYMNESMGIFYLDKVDDDEGLLSFEAYGLLNILNNRTYYSQFWNNVDSEEVFADVLSGFDYVVDEDVAHIKITGYIPRTNKKDALKYILIACNAVVREGRDGKLYIYKEDVDDYYNDIIGENSKLEGWSNADMIVAGEPVIITDTRYQRNLLSIGKEQQLSSIVANYKESYKRCNATYLQYKLDEEDRELYNRDVSFDSEGNGIIEFSKAIVVTSVQDADGNDLDSEIYADTIFVTGTPNTVMTVVVTGKQYEETTQSVIENINIDEIAYDYAAKELVLDSFNNLITNNEQARQIAKYMLEMMSLRVDVEFDWESVITVEAGDYVNIEHDKGSKAILISEIEYDLSNLISTVKGSV